jgi:hypothetical protein
VVTTAALATWLLMSDQLPGLLGSASRTSARWSSGWRWQMLLRGCFLLGYLAVQAEHASHLCVCSQTSVEITHIYQI